MLVCADISLQTSHDEGMFDVGQMAIIWQVKWFILTGISFSLGDNQIVLWDACTLVPYQLLKFLLFVEHKLCGLYQGGLALDLG